MRSEICVSIQICNYVRHAHEYRHKMVEIIYEHAEVSKLFSVPFWNTISGLVNVKEWSS